MTIKEALNEIGRMMVEDTKKRFEEVNRVASGKLRGSIVYEIKELDNGSFRMRINTVGEASKYAKYTEIGRPPGKQPPLDKIVSWTKYKAIDSKYAYPIAVEIGKVGYRGIPVFATIYNKYEKVLTQEIEESMLEYLEEFIAKNTKKK